MLKSLSSIQPGFDWQRLDQLAGEDADFAVELLAMFLKDAESSLSILERSISTGSLQAIEDTAHTLRGSSANVGAIALSTMAMQLEEAARSGEMTKACSLLQQLCDRRKMLQAELSTRLKG